MAKLVALEWDAQEARVAVGRSRGRDLVVEAAFAVDLGPAEGEARDPEEVGKRLAAALAARGVGKAEALVGVARSLIELRQMQLPPCPEAEQADMVRLQAMRQFTAIGDDWPLDFVTLQSSGEGAEEALEVVAASINPELVGRVHEVCQIADLSAKRLVLRPFAAALLYRRETGDQSGCRMLVDILAHEADLTVLVDGQVVFMRTVRLPASIEAQPKAILGEIRRTIGAAQNQTGGRRVEHLILCGDESEHAALKAAIDDKLSIDIDFFDPFAGVHIDGELEAGRPELPGSYAPLLGMLMAEVTNEKHDLDFLNPRKRPKPKSMGREYGLVAGGVALILLLLGGFIWMELGSRNKTLAALRNTVESRKELVNKSKKLAADIGEIEEFVDSDITWLDELREISDRIPQPDQAIITNLVITPRTDGDGQITIEGLVDKSARVSELERALKFANHRVIPKSTDFNDKGTTYKWRFNVTSIVAAKKDEAAAPTKAPAGKQATSDPDGDRAAPDKDTDPASKAAVEKGDSDPKDSDPKDSDPKDSDPKDSDPKDSDPKDSDPKDSAPRDADSNDPDGEQDAASKEADSKDAGGKDDENKKSNPPAEKSDDVKTASLSKEAGK